jgi:O-antigen ligase
MPIFTNIKFPGDNMLNSRILPAIGPFLFGVLCLTQPFSRGLTNIAYGLLVFWSLVWLVYGRKRWPIKVKPIPKSWFKGFVFFILVYLLTSFIGDNPQRSLSFLPVKIYVILALPIAWLALSHWPRLIYFLPFLYGLGLLITWGITFYDADFCVKCVRSKGTLGVIELSGVLIQLAPLIVGALAIASKQKKVAHTAFFLVVLAASFITMIVNCGRITILLLPLLSAIMFIVNYRNFKNLGGVLLVITSLASVIILLNDNIIVSRFKDIFSPPGVSANNNQRFTHWEHGAQFFVENPVFGVGPACLPNLPTTKKVNRNSSSYTSAHNIYLVFLSEMGILGLAAFLYFITRPMELLRPHCRSKDQLTFFWSWTALTVMLHLFLNGVTDQIFTNKIIMYLHFSVMGTAMWVALGRFSDQDQHLTEPKGAVTT